jgi:hypothetical protein
MASGASVRKRTDSARNLQRRKRIVGVSGRFIPPNLMEPDKSRSAELPPTEWLFLASTRPECRRSGQDHRQSLGFDVRVLRALPDNLHPPRSRRGGPLELSLATIEKALQSVA